MKKALFSSTIFLSLLGAFLPNCYCGSWVNPYGESPLPDAGMTDFCQRDQVPRESLVAEMTKSCFPDAEKCQCYCPNWKGCENGEVYGFGLSELECGRENIGHLCGPPSVRYRCKKGCRKDCHGEFENRYDYRAYCEENRPKKAGDPCEDESDCLPITSHIDITYQKQLVIHGYLRCDKALGKCVNTPPPPQKDFMQPCGSALKYDEYKGKRGYFTTSSCQDGVCYAFGLEEDQCVYQGCTRYCKDHHECPQDSLCDTMSNLNQKEGETQGAKICTRMYGNTLKIGAKYMQCVR
jgi:hypothetical protein